jgi:hypothetical protein
MYINSNLLEASLETRTKADIADALKIPPSIGRVLYDANGNVIRVGDGTKFKNSSDLELRTTAELATDVKYLGATRYDSTIDSMVFWNGTEWISARAGDLAVRTTAQLAFEIPMAGRAFYNSTIKRMVFGDGVGWLGVAIQEYLPFTISSSGNFSLLGIEKNVRIKITASCVITFTDIVNFAHEIHIKCLTPVASIGVSGGKIDGNTSYSALRQYQAVSLRLNTADTTELLVW